MTKGSAIDRFDGLFFLERRILPLQTLRSYVDLSYENDFFKMLLT